MSAEFDETVDVVVVGFGVAGSAAVLTASSRGASAVLLERQDSDSHTPSTRMSGGLIMGVNDAEAGATYLDACTGGMVPSSVSRAWAERAVELNSWLDQQGLELHLHRVGGPEHPDFEGAEGIDVLQQGLPRDDYLQRDLSVVAAGFEPVGRNTQDPTRRTGRDLYASLREAVEARDSVDVRWGHRAMRLITDESGGVTGVEASVDGTTVRIGARAGVILTCGGYEFDEEMKDNYLKARPIHFYGNPGNTGDGVRMAQAVGASLWHMNQMVGRAIGHFTAPDGEVHNFALRLDPPGYVIVDKAGRRFANEYPQAKMKHSFYNELLVFDSDKREFSRIPCYWIFDRRRLEGGPLTSRFSGRPGVGLFPWSEDNRAEIDLGWIAEGDTVQEAAERAGIVAPDEAAATVEAYNRACADGVDALGRPAESLVPLDSPPYYCVPLYPGGSNTSGGPRRDEHGQVLNSFGEPIPGLYAAGELGQPFGFLYPSDGANLSEGLCFGQIAVESALESIVSRSG
jgi:succinate dehydrogenase/fumarate reductase flavoprotein subunit